MCVRGTCEIEKKEAAKKERNYFNFLGDFIALPQLFTHRDVQHGVVCFKC